MKKYFMLTAMVTSLVPSTGLCGPWDDFTGFLKSFTGEPKQVDTFAKMGKEIDEVINKTAKNLSPSQEKDDLDIYNNLLKNSDVFCDASRAFNGIACGVDKEEDDVILKVCAGHIKNGNHFDDSKCKAKIKAAQAKNYK
jgi:hypothetical protein